MSKLSTVVDALRSELNSGAYAPGSRFPSEYRLAEKYAVNKTTANKAVAVLVSEGLLSRGGRGGGTLVEQSQPFPLKQFAYIGNIQNPYYALLFYGLQQAALAQYYLLNIIAPPADQLCRFLPKLSAARISGIFSCSYGFIDAASIPVIYLEENAFPFASGCHFVTCDSYLGGYQMMQELLKRNHRNIVIFFRHGHTPSRIKGFHQAMQEAGIMDVHERTFQAFEASSSFECQHFLQKILQLYPGLTAIASTSDNDIALISKAADQLGIPWRGKIAMTGFGKVAGISDLLPIATVDQHPQQIGQEALLGMMNLLKNPQLTIREHLGIELVGLENLPVLPC